MVRKYLIVFHGLKVLLVDCMANDANGMATAAADRGRQRVKAGKANGGSTQARLESERGRRVQLRIEKSEEGQADSSS
jgi:hypothetical protein